MSQIADTIRSFGDDASKMLIGDVEVSYMSQATPWKRVLNAARATIGKARMSKDPSDSWKAKILLAEHSPIRLLEYDFGWKNIRQWVTTHLVRHHEGCEKFVHSQRKDRRELPMPRDMVPQGSRNEMDMSCNAQAMISISRKRLCSCASPETREAWTKVLDELEKVDPILRSKCVRECVYRGFCPEWMSSCKYTQTKQYKEELAEYRNTRYGKDVHYATIPELERYVISDRGKVYWNYSIGDIADGEPRDGAECLFESGKAIPYEDVVESNLVEANGFKDEKYPLALVVASTFNTMFAGMSLDWLATHTREIEFKDMNPMNLNVENISLEIAS